MFLTSLYAFYADTRTIPQAYPPVLLERKAVAIRKAMDEEKALGMPICISMEIADRQCVDHISILSHAYISGSWRAMFSKRLIRPFRLFIHEPIVQLLGFYMAYVFGIIYSMPLRDFSILRCLTCFSIHYDNIVDLPRCIP